MCLCACVHTYVCACACVYVQYERPNHPVSIDCLDGVFQLLLEPVALRDVDDSHEQKDLPPISGASGDTPQQHTAGDTNKQHMKAVKVQNKKVI